jgi:hypothetical protein
MVQSTPSIFGKVDQPSRGDIEVFTGDERKMAGNVSLSSTRGGSTTPETRAETWIDTYKHHGSRAFFKRIAAAWNDTAGADLDWRKSNRARIKQSSRAEDDPRTPIDHTSDCPRILNIEIGPEARSTTSDGISTLAREGLYSFLTGWENK